MSTQEYQQIMRRLDRIEQKLDPVTGKWISEDQAMSMTGLGKDSLRQKRKSGVFNFSTATGRKIKYLRADIVKYLDKNSTIV